MFILNPVVLLLPLVKNSSTPISLDPVVNSNNTYNITESDVADICNSSITSNMLKLIIGFKPQPWRPEPEGRRE